MTSWFRRQHDAAPAPEPEPDDSPAVLTKTLAELVVFINAHAGRIPPESVVAARLVTDAVRDVIDTAENGALDIHAGLSAKAILNDYLPTTLRAYLALDPTTLDVPAAGGRTPNESLLDQLSSLLSGAEDVRAAARSRDVDALVSQGSFLRTKFTGSDLDLQMASMRRGANVSLTREIPGLRAIAMGVKWDAGSETALADNLVMAVVLCDDRGHALSDEHFVFFNQLTSPDLSVHELEHALGGDNEQVEIDLAAVPGDVDRIVAVLYINDGPAQRRTLGQLRSCIVRILNSDGNQELVRSEDLAPALTSETALVLGEVYRHNGEWKFKVLGQGYAKGLAGIAADYGLTL